MDDVFLLVLAGHLIGDFVVQTDRQAANKERSWRADLAPRFGHHLTGGCAGGPCLARLEVESRIFISAACAARVSDAARSAMSKEGR